MGVKDRETSLGKNFSIQTRFDGMKTVADHQVRVAGGCGDQEAYRQRRAKSQIPLIDGLRRFYDKEFAGERYFSIVYGSCAYGVNCSESDIDMVTVSQTLDERRMARTIDFTLDFHRRNRLMIDNEVPFRRKLVATFDQMEKAIDGQGFERRDGKLIVPPVMKTERFLDSEELGLRLLLNALCGKSIHISGDKTLLDESVRKARRAMVAFIMAIENEVELSVGCLVQLMIGKKELQGEEYLGFKDKPQIRSYLEEAFKQALEELVAEGKLERRKGIWLPQNSPESAKYRMNDYSWICSALNGSRTRVEPAMMDFSSNINAFGAPQGVKDNISDVASRMMVYPDATARDASGRISRFFGVPQDHVKALSGSTEFFYMAPEALGIKRGIVISPSFWYSIQGLKRWGREVVEVPGSEENGFKPDIGAVRAVIQKNGRKGGCAVYLCSPNNPVGDIIQKEKILRIAGKFPDVTFIVDETYLLFQRDFDRLTLAKNIPEFKNIIVVASFSKFFGVPGARVGAVVAAPDKIALLDGATTPFRINALGARTLELLFNDEEFIRVSRLRLVHEREYVTMRLGAMDGIHAFPSEANFILCRITDGRTTSTRLAQKLERKGLRIRDCSGYGNLDDRFFRIGIRTHEENGILMDALEETFGKV